MGFVRKFPNDVFLSYAHNDSPGWRNAFERALQQELTDRLGALAEIWRDKSKLRVGHDWPRELETAIKDSAVFISILSPSYQRSEWCKKEREVFLGQFAALDDAKVPTRIGELYRFQKVVRMPWDDNQHREFLPQAEDAVFYREGEDRVPEELAPGRKEFNARLRALADSLKWLLVALKRSGETVFVATANAGVSEAEKSLRNQLAADGYDVRPDGPIDRHYTDKAILDSISPAALSVHLLGTEVDETSVRQLKLAQGLGKSLVLWLFCEPQQPESRITDFLLPGLLGAGVPARPPAVLSGTDTRAKIEEIQELLTRLADAEPRPEESHSSVYVVHDASVAEDADLARTLGAEVAREGLRVLMPRGAAESSRDTHYRSLRDSDGVLLCHQAAPLDWLRYNLQDVWLADRLDRRSRPLRARAFVLSNPDLVKDYRFPNVIPTAQFTAASLEGFLAPLRTGGAASGVP